MPRALTDQVILKGIVAEASTRNQSTRLARFVTENGNVMRLGDAPSKG